MLKKEKNTFTTRIIYKISMSIWSEKYLQRGIAEYIKIIFCHKYPYIFLLRCEPAAQAAVFTHLWGGGHIIVTLTHRRAESHTVWVRQWEKTVEPYWIRYHPHRLVNPRDIFHVFLHVIPYGFLLRGWLYLCVYLFSIYTFYFSFENSHNSIYILFVIHAAADTNRSGDGSWRFE